jgi:hypothetical protein
MSHTFPPEALLHKPLMANLATTTHDGAPRNAPVWFLWEDGALWIPATEGGSSARRLRHDPRCAVEIVEFDGPGGILLHLGMRGRGEVMATRPALFRRLLGKYLGPEDGWNPWFIDTVARIDAPDTRLIRMSPDSTFTSNVSYFRTGPALAANPGAAP